MFEDRAVILKNVPQRLDLGSASLAGTPKKWNSVLVSESHQEACQSVLLLVDQAFNHLLQVELVKLNLYPLVLIPITDSCLNQLFL